MSKQSRTVNYVDRQVQGALIRRIVMHWCSFVMVSILCVTALQLVVGNPELTLREHMDAAWGKYSVLVLILATLLPAFMLDTIKLSNRFVGPVMRLRRALKQVADGEQIDELKFRDSDFWQEIAADFNRAAKKISAASEQNQPSIGDEQKIAS